LLVLIVGDGPYRPQIEEHIADLGLSDQIIMPGNQDNVVPWLQAMDVFVLPSYANEGVPQAIVQAMSCRLPVVATSVGSIEEAVAHESTGIVVPPEDPSSLAAAMATLLDDKLLRERYGREARRVAAERFDISHMLDCMEGTFRHVVRAA
jgi:glycosyltransferase involved in cell wall biosynthesis